MKVVAFNGSPRKKGNTSHLLTHLGEALRSEGVEFEEVSLAGKPLRGCVACYKCRQRQDGKCTIETDALNDHVAKMVEADGIVLASPTYFADVTAEMKALIDRSGFVARGNGHLLKRKVGAAVVAVRRGGALTTFDSLNHFFTIGQMIVVGSSYWNFGMGGAPGDVEQDAEGIETMRTLGVNMAWLLRKIHG